MALDLMKEKGVPLEKQKFDWRDIVQVPTSKLDDNALTRVRIILMNGIESEAVRFQHACARVNKELQLALAQVRRVEQHQQTMINWLLPADLSPLETTIGFEQVAIEVTASVAQHEPDPYLAQVYRFGLPGGLRPPVSIFRSNGPGYRGGRQQYSAMLHRYITGSSYRAGTSGAGR